MLGRLILEKKKRASKHECLTRKERRLGRSSVCSVGRIMTLFAQEKSVESR